MDSVKPSESATTLVTGTPTSEQIGLLILNELRALRKDMKEGGQNVRETLNNIIAVDTINRQKSAETVEIADKPSTSSLIR